MPFDPTHAIGEVLGERAQLGFDPAVKLFSCPHLKSICPKRSTNLGPEPYPVCSIWRGAKSARKPEDDLICVCPKRFYQVDFLKDVVAHAWPFSAPANPVVAPEVKMEGFGNVDFVIADELPDGSIGNFLSVELQAIDITGSVYDGYQAVRSGQMLAKRPTYGLNWDNVHKRYITQLIRKGFFHHHWKTKIVAVIQDQVYQSIFSRAPFMTIPNVKDPTVNIIFMTYVFEHDPTAPGQYRPKLKQVIGTGHSSLQAASLYAVAPSADDFKVRVRNALDR